MHRVKIVFLVSLLALIVAPAALAIRFSDESYSPPIGEAGKPYPNWSFTGSGGCGPALPYQFRLLNSSAPPGLTIDTSGLVHGTPTQAGEFSFWLQLSDENPPSASWCTPKTAERQFTIKIVQGLKIQQNSLAPKAATFLSEPYSFQLTATGSGTWSLISGSLPVGVTLNSSTGLISGIPTVAGDFTFKIQLVSGTSSDVQTYTLTVVPKLQITMPEAPAAEVGLPFQLTLKVTGGRAPYKWSATGLPSGVALDQSTAVISGVPSVATSGVVKVTVTDALGLTTTVDVSLPVATKLAIVKRLLPAAKVGRKYIGRLNATGGVGPFKWTILGGRPGSLPPGIKLNAKTGQLSGTPTKAGTYRLQLQVTDKLGVKSAAPFVLKVLKGARTRR
jgi:Putative Ig domain